MPKKGVKSVNVVKIPNDKPYRNYPQEFPRMPRLYLEIIENKAKIKQDLINKEHEPITSPVSINSFNNNIDEGYKKGYDNNNYSDEKSDSEDEFRDRRDLKKRKNKRDWNKLLRDDIDDNRTKRRDNDNHEEEDEDEEEYDDYDEDDNRRKPKRNNDNDSFSNFREREDEDEETKTNYSSENLSVRLKEL